MIHSATEPVLDIEQLQVALPRGADREFAIDGVSLRIQAGETLCLVGESGSGKSVLATTVMGLLGRDLAVRGGRVSLCGQSLIDAGRSIANGTWRALRGTGMGMVFQEPTTALNPVLACGDQVDELLRAHTSWARSERRARVLDAFLQVRLPDPETMYATYPHQLSGGQRQRIVIAMAMILQPRLLICDEPTTALDVTTQAEILRLIMQLQTAQGSAVLFITHDMGVVAEIADTVVVLHDGRIEEAGTAQSVLRHPRAAYTQMLLASIPGMVPPPARSLSSEGQPAVIAAQALTKSYPQQLRLGRRVPRAVPALAEATLAVLAGETVGIVGESGSGKSTLARCLIRLIEPSAGSIHWGERAVQDLPERELRALRAQVQIVFQDPNRSLNPRRRVGESLVEGAINFGLDPRAARTVALELLERVRLPASALGRYPHQFSGGQRQRLAIARALACRPRVLIADEAVSALDVSVQAQILDLFRALQDELSIALVFITHDLRVAAQLCDRVLVMQGGRIVEEGATGSVFGNPVHPYTQRLLAAAPRLEVVRGDPQTRPTGLVHEPLLPLRQKPLPCAS